jgi:hypothetical protein
MVRRLELEKLDLAVKYASRRRMLAVVCIGAPLCIIAGLLILIIGIPHLQDVLSGKVKIDPVRQITHRIVVTAFVGAGVLLIGWGCYLIPRTRKLYRKYKEFDAE